MARVKICGLSTAATIDAAVAGGASHVGFVFFPPSPRHVSPEQAASLATRVPRDTGTVGVFVDPQDAEVATAVQVAGLSAVQLHKVSPARAAYLRRLTGLETWVAIAVKIRADLDTAVGFRDAADRLVYDARTPEGALPGGMGLRFDWSLLDGFRHPLPWALSGGLDAANVREAVTRTGTGMVDVSSGVETAPGVKDVDKIAAFLQAARA